MIKHKDIEYTNNDLIELLKLKNISISNMVRVGYYFYPNINIPNDYEFTIIITYIKSGSICDTINIYRDDLLSYNRNKLLNKLTNV